MSKFCISVIEPKSRFTETPEAVEEKFIGMFVDEIQGSKIVTKILVTSNPDEVETYELLADASKAAKKAKSIAPKFEFEILEI